MQLNGLHHVTAVSSQIGLNLDFYTRILGLRLVKKSVNQDDVSAYHLFYADKVGSPGTDMTFFDWPQIGPNQRGTDSISGTAFRVNGRAALDFWDKRLSSHNVKHEGIQSFNGRDLLPFDDPEGQRLILVDDGGAPFTGILWDKTDVPTECALRGFYAAQLSTPRLDLLEPILTQVLGYQKCAQITDPAGSLIHIYETSGGGPGRELWVAEEPHKPVTRLGAGGVHHLALRVADQEEQRSWRERIAGVGLPVSDFIDRFYFHSIYFRISRNILFEIATDGPGFGADENLETLGEKLALPPFLEPHRADIEANLKPIVPPAYT
jgi:glyoxalase family protein